MEHEPAVVAHQKVATPTLVEKRAARRCRGTESPVLRLRVRPSAEASHDDHPDHRNATVDNWIFFIKHQNGWWPNPNARDK
jgi:hypothetical protein